MRGPAHRPLSVFMTELPAQGSPLCLIWPGSYCLVQRVGDSGCAVGHLHFMGEEPTEALLVSLLRGEDRGSVAGPVWGWFTGLFSTALPASLAYSSRLSLPMGV